jgi:hypothetical protein
VFDLKHDPYTSVASAPEFSSSIILSHEALKSYLLVLENQLEGDRPNKASRGDDELKSPSDSTQSPSESVKVLMVSLLLLEKDCFKFYPNHCEGYLNKVGSRLEAVSCQGEPANLSKVLDEEYLALQRALGYTGTKTCSRVPQEFYEADPDLDRRYSYSLDDDGFEVL